jgi:hypothetical protein
MAEKVRTSCMECGVVAADNQRQLTEAESTYVFCSRKQTRRLPLPLDMRSGFGPVRSLLKTSH